MHLRGRPLVLVVCCLVLAAAAYFLFRTTDSKASANDDKAWFTTDDGETFFADNRNKVPPFEVNGKTAVGCYVWTRDGGKTRFVSHLYRLTSEGKKLIESNSKLANDAIFLREHSEVKKPGKASTWMGATDPRAAEIQISQSSAGQNEPAPVVP